jgi:hypothetical protein
MRSLVSRAGRRLALSLANGRDWQLFVLVHAAFVAVCMAPLLLGTHLLSELQYSYPLFDRDTVRGLFTGTAIFNPLNLNGFPSYISTDFFSTNPFTYVFTAFLPRFDNLHWYAFAHMVAGGVLCSMFLRKLDFSKAAAIIGGTSYVTASWLLIVTVPFIGFMPALPLLGLVMLESRTRPLKAGLLAVIVGTYLWWTVFAQIMLMICAACAAAGALMAWRHRHAGRKALPRRSRALVALRPLLTFVIGIVAGGIFVIPKYLPMIVYAGLSWRASGVPSAEATGQGITLFTAIKYLFPYANFPFLNFGGDILMLYMGTFSLVCFLAAIAGRILRLPHTSEGTTRYWILGYLLLFLIAIEHSPLATIISAIPPFSFFRGAGRWMFIAGFAVAPIVAAGYDLLIQGKAEDVRRKLAKVIGTLTYVLCAGLLIIQVILMMMPQQLIGMLQRYFTYFHDALHLGPPVSYYTAFVERRITELAAHPFFLEPKTLLPLLALIAVAVVLQKKTWETMKRNEAALVLIALSTSALVLCLYNQYVPRSLLTNPPATAVYLQQHPGTAVALLPEEGAITSFKTKPSTADRAAWDLAHIVPNANLFYDLPVIDYFDNVASRRPSTLYSWAGAIWAGEHWIVGPDHYRIIAVPGTTEDRLRAYVKRKDVMDVVGLRYIVSSFALPDERFVKVFEANVTPQNLPIAIYENTNARPKAYFASPIQTMPESESGALKRMLESAWPGKTSLLECEPDCALRDANGNGTVTMITNSDSALAIKTDSRQPQWLIVNVNRLPGWIVTVDEIPAESVYANGTFFGIAVPAGTHTVDLRFSLWEVTRKAIQKMSGGSSDVN